MSVRSANRLGQTLLALLLVAGNALATTAEEDPAAWLTRMGQALKEQNYEGIFTYMRGSTFDTVRIVHANVDGEEYERLFNLNGEVRELYRHGDEVLCFHPHDAGHENMEHSVQLGPFSPAFSERVLSTQNLYNLGLQGEGRIAGRAAVVLAISPRNNDRYGYRVWLDRETGLLLQSHLIDRGRIKEIFQFTMLQIGHEIPDAMLATAIPGETISHTLALETNDRTDKPVWRVKWLPDGFRPVRVQGNRLHFSDGLATFSVFVEKPEQATLPDLVTTMGGTVVLTRRMANTGPQITVVGKVPVSIAERVAESVEPVLY